jgi:hypothetical protein
VAPPPAPSPEPSPSPSPSPQGAVAVADLKLELRTWDGHGWRRNKEGHVHGKRCGHYWDARLKRWKFEAYEPQEYEYELRDTQWTDASLGVYVHEGKTWYVKGHTHDSSCVHVLLQDPDGQKRYHLRAPEK